MATVGMHSRRKQSKPQRLPEGPNGVIPAETLTEEHDMDGEFMSESPDYGIEMDVQNESASPIDLSTRKASFFEEHEGKTILEDKSNIFLNSLGITSPQQLLSLYSQMARGVPGTMSNGGTPFGGFPTGGHTLMDSMPATSVGGASMGGVSTGEDSSPAPSSTPASRPSDCHQCPAENCGEVLPSWGSLLWHVHDNHPDEKLLECSDCGTKLADWDQQLSHKCQQDVDVARASSVCGIASAREEMDDETQRRSVPVTVNRNFNVIRAKSPSQAPPSLSFLSSLFPLSKDMQSMNPSATEASPLDLTNTPTSQHPPIFPGFPGFPHPFQPHLGGPLPPHFMLRPPFPGGPEMMGPPRGDVVDDDWESLMEVSNTDEAEKIRQLVGDKALPTTDPNQCILCRRVLSCKSALQMHYRTHTGERPFKCKICQRAFTTKGNLKTHMGVHRAKHSFRGVGMGGPMLSAAQQCPICQKRFMSGGQLQQHIAEHTQQLRNPMLSQQLNKDRSPHTPHGPPQNGLTLMFDFQPQHRMLPAGFPMFPFPFPPPGVFPQPGSAPPTLVKQETPTSTQAPPPPFNLAQMLGLGPDMPSQTELREEENTLASTSQDTPILPNSASVPNFGYMPNSAPSQSPAPSATATVTVTPTSANNIFAALSQSLGLNIDESKLGFVEPQKSEEPPKTSTSLDSVSPSSSSHASTHDNHEQTDGSSVGRGESEERRVSDPLMTSIVGKNDMIPLRPDQIEMPKVELSEAARKRAAENPLEAMQKMWAEASVRQNEAPTPRPVPVLSKHQCAVCFKHFSSSSALQIHMRTHTGDKPFKCDICARAFTTRGNLKVHMGTHMWQQSPSRRGRRIFDASPMEPRRLFEDENGQPRSSPSLPPLPAGMPPLPGPFPFMPPGAGAPSLDMMMMLMRTVCSVCQKVCSSPQELEQHLKAHLSGSLGMVTTPTLDSAPSAEATPPPCV